MAASSSTLFSLFRGFVAAPTRSGAQLSPVVIRAAARGKVFRGAFREPLRNPGSILAGECSINAEISNRHHRVNRWITNQSSDQLGLTPRVARHCFISLRVFLLSFHSVCSVPFSFSGALVSRPAFTYVRPIQMAKVNFAITKYLARKSLRYGATHHFGAAAATIHGRETPLGLSRRERNPYSVTERNRRLPELTLPT
jgi:hypothetical protein